MWYGDRLEVLGGHHRAHPGASICPVGVADQRTEADSSLSRRAALEHLDAFILQFLSDGVFHVSGELSPKMGGVTQLRLPVLDP